ncbi:aminoglycoside 6'-N-acetyltransferase [Microvirga aerophila]|uniref:Aminoglycoside N(6')-acetyltransferase type 1 n=1 Tax=Microvirga aerophila TaxID=670291 RepID=A0A512BRK6_9HYPH|nr:aminoglycoside 6'-N-acetyltransferase [Microvirga aerophila]GEO14457.1 aminoglycoside N(6')-acetyltransferase type 1 [Microvirga aerophila]
MRIEQCTRESLEDWIILRQDLWPDTSAQEHRVEAEAQIEHPEQTVAYLAVTSDGVAAGFAEAALRHDYVNGCTTSPVAFLEGIYVRPERRNRSVARLLVQAVGNWAIRLGCSEFASDVELHNLGSQQMHVALGFEETERVVYYRKRLKT